MLAKKRKGATEKRKESSGIASLLWMFIGSILTLMIGLFLYLWNPFNTSEETGVPEQRTVEPRNTTTTAEADEYEFYDLLPQQEVASIPDEAVADNSDSETLSDTQRALQEVLLNSEVDVVVTAPDEPAPTSDSNGDSTTEVVAATGDEQIVIIEEEGTYDGTELSGNNTNANTTGDSINNNSAVQRDRNDVAVATAPAQNNIIASGTNNSSRTPKPVNEVATPYNTYILQINSFSSAEEADGRRAQVLMAGVDAQVVKKELPNGQVFYQVVTPPMRNRQAIALEQQRLQNNGIDSLIVEQQR